MKQGLAGSPWGRFVVTATLSLQAFAPCLASDHLDTRTVIDDPRADIGDIYAWTSPDGERLNLVMAIVGHTFSDALRYRFHVDSGARFGETGATVVIECRFPSTTIVACSTGDADRLHGSTDKPAGTESESGGYRVFAGLRDDPFFNNVVGSRDAYQVAANALKRSAAMDAASCPALDQATSRALLREWRQTEGGPGRNFLKGWTPAALVVSIDLDAVALGGNMLAVWATTSSGDRQLDRMGRPLTGNALLAPLAPDEVSDALKEQYNAAEPPEWGRLVPAIQQTLGLYDGFDGVCGNQLLADHSTEPAERYRAMAELLADDRLWIDSTARTCEQFFAVELAHLAGRVEYRNDCGGRTPNQDAVDVYRSLLATGATTGVDDGVHRDEREHSTSVFPFLAPPTDDAYRSHRR